MGRGVVVSGELWKWPSGLSSLRPPPSLGSTAPPPSTNLPQAHFALAARQVTGSPTEASCQSLVAGGPASRAVLAKPRVGDPSGQLIPRTDAWGPFMAAGSSWSSGIQSVPIEGASPPLPPGPRQRCSLSGLWAWTLQAAGLSAAPSFCPASSLLRLGGCPLHQEAPPPLHGPAEGQSSGEGQTWVKEGQACLQPQACWGRYHPVQRVLHWRCLTSGSGRT